MLFGMLGTSRCIFSRSPLCTSQIIIYTHYIHHIRIQTKLQLYICDSVYNNKSNQNCYSHLYTTCHLPAYTSDIPQPFTHSRNTRAFSFVVPLLLLFLIQFSALQCFSPRAHSALRHTVPQFIPTPRRSHSAFCCPWTRAPCKREQIPHTPRAFLCPNQQNIAYSADSPPSRIIRVHKPKTTHVYKCVQHGPSCSRARAESRRWRLVLIVDL